MREGAMGISLHIRVSHLLRTAGVGLLGLALATGALAESAQAAPRPALAPMAPDDDPTLGGGQPPAEDFIDDERLVLELMYAQSQDAGGDLRGFQKSLYQGRWFAPRHERVRKCISWRESHHKYEAVSRGGLYRGAYQMSPQLGVGATWMMQKEVRRDFGDVGLELLQQIRQLPINQWNRYWQDRAFYTIYRKGKGAKHWRSDVYNCKIKKKKRN
jgi:hypothetical protein